MQDSRLERPAHLPADPGEAPERAHLEGPYLWERSGWVIRLRWIAIAGVLLVVTFAWQLALLARPEPLLVIAAFMMGANLVHAAIHARTGGGERISVLRSHLLVQLVLDVACLAMLLHWSDGIENPFAMLYALELAIAGKLLPPRLAYTVAGAAVLLHTGVTLGEHLGWLEHHRLLLGDGAPLREDPLIHSPLHLAAVLSALSMTMFGTVYFMASASKRYRLATAEQARLRDLAASRARFAQLGELAGGVAHSIRNPLHGLLNCVDLLRGQVPTGGDAAETLTMMEEGLGRIQVLTHRLLTYTRESAPTFSPQPLGDLVDDAIERVHAARRGPGPSITRAPGPPVWVAADADRLCEAVLNVLDNAASACGERGHVTVRVLPPGDSDRLACVEVLDDGSGIAPEDVPHVFDPFFTTKPVGQGTGLGLALTRRVVEEHGGSVALASTPGEGTCVRLRFPAVARPVQSERP